MINTPVNEDVNEENMLAKRKVLDTVLKRYISQKKKKKKSLASGNLLHFGVSVLLKIFQPACRDFKGFFKVSTQFREGQFYFSFFFIFFLRDLFLIYTIKCHLVSF